MTSNALHVFVDPDVCVPCGGRCCKTAPGMAVPSDFGPPDALKEALTEALRSGRWTIEAGPDTPGVVDGYIVRPAIKGDEGLSFSTRTFGECTFLDPVVGCLIFEKRPAQCRAVKPSKAGACKVVDPSYMILDAWQKHQDLLQELSVIAPERTGASS